MTSKPPLFYKPPLVSSLSIEETYKNQLNYYIKIVKCGPYEAAFYALCDIEKVFSKEKCVEFKKTLDEQEEFENKKIAAVLDTKGKITYFINDPPIKDITISNVGLGYNGNWATSSPEEILKDINTKIKEWQQSVETTSFSMLDKTEELKKSEPELIALTETEALVDEYLILQEKYEELRIKEIIGRLSEIKKQLQLIAEKDDVNTSEKRTLKSPKGEITLSERSENLKVVKVSELLDDLNSKHGEEAMFKCINVSLTQLKKLYSKEELKNFCEVKLGNRSIEEIKYNVS